MRLGVEVSYYDPLLGAAIEREFRPNTRLVFTESPGSLTFCVQDIPAIAAVAHRRGALVVTDNSWATPFGFRSFDHGVDVSVHAATKYIGGHSDVLAGADPRERSDVSRRCTGSGRTWASRRRPTIASSRCAACARCRLRLARHVESALTIAQWLQHAARGARGDLSRRFPARAATSCGSATSSARSGLFAVVLQPVAKARIDAMLDGMRLFGMGWSWGGFESLHHSDLSGARADRHDVGRRRTVPAACDRARGSGRPDRRPGARTRAALRRRRRGRRCPDRARRLRGLVAPDRPPARRRWPGSRRACPRR